MSVTFAHDAEPIISGWRIECGCGQWSSQEYSVRDDAVAALAPWHTHAEVVEGCTDDFCRASLPFVKPNFVGVEPMMVNFANGNARHILSVLGVPSEDELFGSMTLDDFERALVLATPTSGTPSRATVNVGGEFVTVDAASVTDFTAVRAVECGRDSEYDTRALDLLRALLMQARELHAAQVHWA